MRDDREAACGRWNENRPQGGQPAVEEKQNNGIRPLESNSIKAQEDKAVEVKEAKPVKAKAAKKRKPKDSEVTVNIKILKSQQRWLRDTAQDIRDNNDEPVASKDRVFPQHLIQVAIAHLQNADIDWASIKTAEDLKKELNL